MQRLAAEQMIRYVHQQDQTLIQDRYEVLGTLGSGGEARVVKALDRRHARIVALKIRPAGDERTRADLLNEARILLAVPPHPALPLVREDFFDADDYVVAMDWVDGTDLAVLLGERGTPGLAPSSVLAYLAEAAEALTHLHAQYPPVIHGDVKPANLILTRGGHIKLVDFGLSSAPGAVRRRLGTPGFRAPELAVDGTPSRASDVYALAATAFALLTGSAPAGVLPTWEGFDPEQAEQLEAALRLGLATNPERRPATPGELVERLRSGWGAALPTGVMTFCLSDIEGSTGLWETQPAAMAEALVRHDEIVAAEVETRGGRFLKSMGEGDSTVSVFTSSPDAVAAAAAITRALREEPWPADLAIAVRIGVHTGEAERRGADYFGPTLNMAGRLRGQADGGQVFLSSTTAALTAGHLPPDCDLVDLGPHRLKGLSTPESIYALRGPDLAAPFPATDCPYRGLLAFEPADRAFFFGRESVVSDVLGRLAAGRLLAVIGASGSGKSSVLSAGVAAAVLAGEVPGLDRAVISTPDPDGDLEDDPRTLVIVDQFEELYTLCDDAARRDAFIDRLLALRPAVVIGMRADLYGRLSTHAGLARAVAGNQVLLGAMSDADLARAITEPARLAGLKLDAGLVDLILRDVAREPGALPLLSHALRVTWEHRDGRTLTVEGYRASGGVASAVARTADAVVASVPEERQGLLRNLFVRLTELGEGSEDTRRRVAVDELVPEDGQAEAVEALLERLADARLVTLGENTAEVAHEVLIREWPTLRGWLEEDRAGLRLHRQLGDAARLWAAGGEEATDLYRGTRLEAAREWAAGHPKELNATERAFLDASVADAEGERRRQLRANRRLRALLAGAGVLLVLAVIAGAVALSQRETARDAARSEAAQRLGAEAVTLDRPDRALQLANAGHALDDSLATRSNFLRVLLRSPAAIGVLNGDGDALFEIATSSDGALVAVGDINGDVTIFDAASHERIGGYLARGVEIGALEFAPGSDQLAIVGRDRSEATSDYRGTLQIIDARSQRMLRSVALRHPFGPEFPQTFVATYTPDGRSIVVGYAPLAPGPAFLHRFDAADGSAVGRPRRVPPMAAFPTGFYSTTDLLSTSDGRLVYPGEDATYAIDNDSLPRLRRYPSRGRPLAVSASDTLALGGDDGQVRLLDLGSGRTRVLPDRHQEPVLSAAFSPDGRTLATGAEGGAVILWNLEERRPLETLAGHTRNVADLRFSPDGTVLYSASVDGSAIAWDVSGTRRLGTRFETGLVAVPVDTYPPAFTVRPDGRELAVARLDGKVDLIDAETLETRTTFQAFDDAPATAIEYAPDGRRLAVAGVRGFVGLFDARTGERIGPFVDAPRGACADPDSIFEINRCFEATIQALAFAEGGLLATASIGGTLRIRDAETRRPLRPPLRLPPVVTGMDVSPDGSTLAVTFGFINPENGVEILDVRSGERVARLVGSGEPRSVAFSPDGRRLVSGQTDGNAVVWDTDTWRQVGGPLGHRGLLIGVRFSPDARTLATSSSEGTVVLWDVGSRTPIGSPLPLAAGRRPPQPHGADRWVTARFTPDGARLFAVYANGHAVRWALEPDAWRRHACRVAGGGLTRDEWADVVPEQDYRETC